jgi:tRNA(fMet)-specific endonuclease VapC
MLYLLDTNAVSDYMAGHPVLRSRVSALFKTDRLRMCTIVRGEILFGIAKRSPGARRSQLELAAHAAFRAFPCMPVPEQAADVYSSLKLTCQQTGVAIHENDLWIAATALAEGAILVSRDKDFTRFPSLVLQDWTV